MFLLFPVDVNESRQISSAVRCRENVISIN